MVQLKSLACLVLLATVAVAAPAKTEEESPAAAPPETEEESLPKCPTTKECGSATGIFRCEMKEGEDGQSEIRWTQCKSGTWTVNANKATFENAGATHTLGQFAALTIAGSALSALIL